MSDVEASDEKFEEDVNSSNPKNNKKSKVKTSMANDNYKKKKAELNKKLNEARKRYKDAPYKKDIVTSLGGFWFGHDDDSHAPNATRWLAKKNAKAYMMTRSKNYKNKFEDWSTAILNNTVGVPLEMLGAYPESQLDKDIDAVYARWRASGKTYKEMMDIYDAEQKAAGAEIVQLKKELAQLDKDYKDSKKTKPNNNTKKPKVEQRTPRNEPAPSPSPAPAPVEGQEGPTTKEYKDENGNVVATATYDKDGKMLSCTFKDKDGNDQTLKADEIKKTNVSIDDIKNALESGDLNKALELLMEALMSKNNNYQPLQQQITSKTYKDEANNATFRVDKQGDKVSSITFMEEGVMRAPLTLTADHFSKAGVDPKNIETALEGKDYRTAALGMFDVAAKNNIEIQRYLEPTVAIKDNAIVLTDRVGNTYELTEEYLKSQGVKKGKAEKTMKNLRELIASGKAEQSVARVVASYMAKENPAPQMPATNSGYVFEKLGKRADGKSITIKVRDASGKERELGYKDFAEAYGCTKEQAKKLRDECIRSIKNGGDVNGVLSEVANNSRDRGSNFWTKGWVKATEYAVGAAAVGVGAYAAFGGFKKKGGDEEEYQPEATVATGERKVTLMATSVSEESKKVVTTETPAETPTENSLVPTKKKPVNPVPSPTLTPEETPTDTKSEGGKPYNPGGNSPSSAIINAALRDKQRG